MGQVSTPGDSSSRIDYGKYYSPDVVEAVASIINGPRRMLSIVRIAGVVVLGAWILLALLFSGQLFWLWLIGVAVYGTVAALLVGVLFGYLVTLHSTFGNLLLVFDCTTDVAERVRDDLKNLNSENLPSSKKVLTGVYEHIISRAVLKVVRSQLWIAGPLMAWGYSKTFDRFFRKAISILPDGGNSNSIAEPPVKATEDNTAPIVADPIVEEMNASTDNAESSFAAIRKRVHRYALPIRMFVMLPFIVVSAVATVVLVSPLVLIYFQVID